MNEDEKAMAETIVRLLAEVERLRTANADYSRQEKKYRAEVERLRALYDLHTGGAECPFEAEVERLRRQSDNNIEAFYRVAEENERLRAVLKQIMALEPDNATDCWYIARNALQEGKE